MASDRSQSPRRSRHWAAAVALAAVCALPGIAVAADGDGPKVDRAAVEDSRAPFVPGEAIVRFEPGTTPSERLAARQAGEATLDQALRLPQAQLFDVAGGGQAGG